MNERQYTKMREAAGFVAALDQSVGSTAKALQRYGIHEWADESEMKDRVHELRTRIITSPAFDGDRIIGVILFIDTLRREMDGMPTAAYLWQQKHIVPILKVDKGLEAEVDGGRLMKPIPDLREVCEEAVAHEVFATKMRSFITGPGAGLDAVVEQQFDVAGEIIDAGLVPVLEPEIDITTGRKQETEQQLLERLRAGLDALGEGRQVMLKLTPPEEDDLYHELVAHPRVVRVLALSGGYSRGEACDRLARQHGVVASFSRALTEGLNVHQDGKEFDEALDRSISEVYAASIT